ncbi:hypothetical protein D3C80_1541320 [compost metagenome]
MYEILSSPDYRTVVHPEGRQGVTQMNVQLLVNHPDGTIWQQCLASDVVDVGTLHVEVVVVRHNVEQVEGCSQINRTVLHHAKDIEVGDDQTVVVVQVVVGVNQELVDPFLSIHVTTDQSTVEIRPSGFPLSRERQLYKDLIVTQCFPLFTGLGLDYQTVAVIDLLEPLGRR